MIYLIGKNKLPWSDFGKRFKDEGYDLKQMLIERQKFVYTEELFDIVPKPLKGIVKKILMLSFDEEPPYDLIIEKIKREILKNVTLGPDLQPEKHCFEWANSHALKLSK